LKRREVKPRYYDFLFVLSLLIVENKRDKVVLFFVASVFRLKYVRFEDETTNLFFKKKVFNMPIAVFPF